MKCSTDFAGASMHHFTIQWKWTFIHKIMLYIPDLFFLLHSTKWRIEKHHILLPAQIQFIHTYSEKYKCFMFAVGEAAGAIHFFLLSRYYFVIRALSRISVTHIAKLICDKKWRKANEWCTLICVIAVEFSLLHWRIWDGNGINSSVCKPQ